MKRIFLALFVVFVACVAISSVSAASDADMAADHDGRYVYSLFGQDNPVSPFDPNPNPVSPFDPNPNPVRPIIIPPYYPCDPFTSPEPLF